MFHRVKRLLSLRLFKAPNGIFSNKLLFVGLMLVSIGFATFAETIPAIKRDGVAVGNAYLINFYWLQPMLAKGCNGVVGNFVPS